MSEIVLSYAREDKWYIDDIYRALKEAGLSPWMDDPPPPYRSAGIAPGSSWEATIRSKLSSARVVLIFLSENSVQKRGYVQREYKIALNEMSKQPPGAIYLVPVLLEQCEVPDVEVDMIRLRDYQWYELYSRGIDDLVQHVAEVVGKAGEVDFSRIPQRPLSFDREIFWDADLASVNGLILIYMAFIAKQNKVSILYKELFERISIIDLNYAYGFLVALRAAKLIVFRSDFSSYWAFDYIHPALTKDFSSGFERRLQKLLSDEGMSEGDGAPFEAELREIEDYVKERVQKERGGSDASDDHA